MNHTERVQSQFGPVAAAYATSATHASATALQAVLDLAQPSVNDRVLDIATGAGNVALAFAPLVRDVVAVDITLEMLAEVRRRADEYRMANVETLRANAESIPLPDESFDIVVVRTAPHHFADINAAVREMARLAKPGGRVIVVDTSAPDNPADDERLNQIEVLRDPSHVRNYTAREWRQMIADAGLRIESLTEGLHALGKKMPFSSWTERMRVDAATQARLRDMFLNASKSLRDLMDITEEDGDIWFTLPEITLLARKPFLDETIETP